MPQRKSVKKTGIDSNPPVLAGNFPFLANISDLPFSLDILPVFETLPFRCLTRLFTILLFRFFFFFMVSLPFYPFGIRP